MGSIIEPLVCTDAPDPRSVRGVHPGCFIAIEGVDGAGKTTVAKRLVASLNEDRSHGYQGALYAREPGGTPFGDSLRAAFLDAADPLHPMTEVLALLAAKNELIEKVIRPAIREGQIVICDRFTRSLLAYQGGLRDIPMPELVALLGQTGLLIMPNLELFLHVDQATSRLRRGTALNHLDTAAEEQADKLRQGFTQAVDALPPTRRIDVDASSDEDSVYSVVRDEVLRYLKFYRVAGLTLNVPLREYYPTTVPTAASTDSALVSEAVDDLS